VEEEIWKDIIGYEGIYQVSSHGRIKRIKPGKGAVVGRILKICPDTNGYAQLNLYNEGEINHVQVHRLVAQAFLTCPSGNHQVNHKNGDPLDNRVSNLEWVTPSQNLKHAYRVLGRNTGGAHGEKAPSAKLTANQVRKIRSLYASGKYTLTILGEMFGVTFQAIHYCVQRKTWKHIP